MKKNKLINRKKSCYAYYDMNQFHIVFDSENPFLKIIKKDIIPIYENYGTFVHEYWHYLLNISTIIHYRELYLNRSFMSLFSHTIINNKTHISNGGDDLTNDQIEDFESLSELSTYYHGDNIPGNIDDDEFIKDFKILCYRIEDPDLYYHNKKIPISTITLEIEIKKENDSNVTTEFSIGLNAIEESIANSVENIFNNSGEIEETNYAYQAAKIQYLILKKLSIFFFGVELTDYELISIGTLSLLTFDVALSLINIFEEYKQIRNPENIENSILLLKVNSIDLIKSVKNEIISSMASLIEENTNRGPAGKAFISILNFYARTLGMRERDPLFDLAPLMKGKFNQDEFDKLLNMIPPCDLIQEVKRLDKNGNDKRKDFMVSFSDLFKYNNSCDFDINSYSEDFSILHCQNKFMENHMAQNTFFSTADVEKYSEDEDKPFCPYFYICSNKFRKKNKDLCYNSPWININKRYQNTHHRCVYTIGVLSYIGLFK